MISQCGGLCQKKLRDFIVGEESLESSCRREGVRIHKWYRTDKKLFHIMRNMVIKVRKMVAVFGYSWNR